MSSSRMSRASSKQSATSSAGTSGASRKACLYRSMLPCRHPGCSKATRSSRPGWSVLSRRAVGVKKRNASKCEQAIRCDSTTLSVPSRPRRSGQSCRVSSARCTIAHSCSPKHPNWAGRPAVATRSAWIRRVVSIRRSSLAATRPASEGSVVERRPGPSVVLGGRVASASERIETLQSHPGPRVPAPQLRGPVGVVGEQEVVHRVLDPVAPTREVLGHQRVHPRLVSRRPGAPRRLVQHLGHRLHENPA